MLSIITVASRPMWRQVRPALVDFHMPSPRLPTKGLMMVGSPVPAYTTSGSEGATAIAPILSTCLMWSKIGNQVTPALVVFQMPPSGVPT